jgi:hypothetical protein
MKNTKNKAAKKTNKGLAHITTWIKPTAKSTIKEIGKREHRTLASQTEAASGQTNRTNQRASWIPMPLLRSP